MDVGRAREIVLQVQADSVSAKAQQRRLEPAGMSESLEREVLRVIERARNALVGS